MVAAASSLQGHEALRIGRDLYRGLATSSHVSNTTTAAAVVVVVVVVVVLLVVG